LVVNRFFSKNFRLAARLFEKIILEGVTFCDLARKMFKNLLDIFCHVVKEGMNAD
jgi:hypothetical protein